MYFIFQVHVYFFDSRCIVFWQLGLHEAYILTFMYLLAFKLSDLFGL